MIHLLVKSTRRRLVVPWAGIAALLSGLVLALGSTPANAELDCSAVEDLDGRAAQYFLGNEFDHARELYEASVSCVPIAETFWRLGMTYGAMGDLDEATQAYQQALELNPGPNIRVNALAGLAATHLKLEDYGVSIEYATEAVDTMKSEIGRHTVWSVWATRSEAYRMLGDLDRALADRTQALELRPHAPYQYNARGLIHSELGDYEAAVADFETALTLEGAPAEVAANLAQAERALRDSATTTTDAPSISYAKSKGKSRGKIAAAAEAGWAVGQWLDEKFDLSDTAADYWAERYPAPGWLQDLF